MFTKKDFTIKGHFTGCRLQGRENEFVYNIYAPNGQLLTNIEFTSKAKANEFLGAVLKRYKNYKKEIVK